MHRNWGTTSRATVRGNQSPGSLREVRTRYLNSYRLPSQSVLHCEDVPDSPLDIGAIYFFLLIVCSAGVGLAIVIYLLSYVGI